MKNQKKLFQTPEKLLEISDGSPFTARKSSAPFTSFFR
jgi:hypothetical protein